MCNACTVPLDEGKAEAFAGQMLGVLNNASIALMCSIGHRVGLFDAMAEMEPSSSTQIAEATKLNERYVREWLGSLTTGGIVAHDPGTNGTDGTYWIPAEHAAFLTRSAGGDNIAMFTRWIGILGYVEDEVAAAFKHGKGVPYSAYRNFNEVMSEVSGQTVVAGLVEHILPLEPGLIDRLEAGIEVLDVGCGCGKAMNHLAGLYPNSTFVGYDFLESATDVARNEAKEKGLTNVRFETADAATFEDTDAFDLIVTFDSVHDQAKPDAMLANIARALKPGGLYLMQDIKGSSSHAGDMDHPIGPFIYAISCMHCMSVSLAHDGMGLGAAWGKATAQKMLAEAGFDNVKIEELPHDITNYYYLCRHNA